MSAGSKRSAQPQGGTSKKQHVSFKMREIKVPGANTTAADSASEKTTMVETTSYQVYDLADGRLGMRQEDGRVSVPQAAPSDWTRSREDETFPPEVAAIVGEYPVDTPEAEEHYIGPQASRKPRARPELRAAAKVQQWLPLREEFLDELLRYYGGEYPVESQEVECAECGTTESVIFRCADCATRRLHCQACILKKHSHLPLHSLEKWHSKHWEKTALRDLGLVFQLGHDGTPCANPSEKTRRVVIGDVTGIHEVQVKFCECLDEDDTFTHQWVQLLRHGWFPATTNRPATAFTFRMLNAFQELNWHLTALKRAGRCHDPKGAKATREGELGLDCPACPHPGKNIPEGWESAPKEIRWIYTLFLMIDANFRAKLKDHGFEDYELGSGWSYYVEYTKYKAHLSNMGVQNDTSSCSAEHKAIQNANLRREGYIASGVGAVLCARHAMVRKTAAGHLPNGEKYLIMDYLLFSTILGLALMLLISYDIACQWHKKLARRARDDLPPHIATDISEKEIRYAIPKKHIRVHGPKHSRFSLNFLRWVGRTYAEGIEAHWAHMNPVALSAKEMGPGMHREHMNDHWGAWNWQKTIGFASYLVMLLREADTMYAKQSAAHESLSATFSAENIEKWKTEIEVWQEDPTKAEDPYEEQRATATLKSARLSIAEEEAKEMAAGTLPPHDVTPGVFLQVGLEIEEQQRAIRTRDKNLSSTDNNLAATQEKRNTLKSRIETWQGLQDLHMPIVQQFRHTGDPAALAAVLESAQARQAAEAAAGANTASQIPARVSGLGTSPAPASATGPPPTATPRSSPSLHAPETPPILLDTTPAPAPQREDTRKAEDVPLWLPFNVSGTGQRTIGKVRTLFSKFQDKVRRAADRYRAARAALESLNKGGDWEVRFKVLRDADLRGPGREGDTGTSEGRFEVSWIWLVPRGPAMAQPDSSDADADLDPTEFLENMKVEWARSQARAERWGEERVLLLEEMRRVVEFFEWKALWWRAQVRRRAKASESPALQRGLSSYAEYQASVYERMASHCAHTWVPYFRQRGGDLPAWCAHFNVPEKKDKGRKRGGSSRGSMPSTVRAGTSASTAVPGEVSSDSGSESSDDSSGDQD
ncbi:hypothetical protein OH76DRAFT_1423978 [Lentinus brumalis]|uniref:CxC2-like cysteine cluster KDZ transposase-associated domain-containing protein n=1 Tax=Lentinus brumalis TaxID=2498619 RepID=A0A371CI88_9APHY|nr:hypothetical protein OH76DRAFT_1423978 [Polyporus brumalis]